jgi:hypothetical protein
VRDQLYAPPPFFKAGSVFQSPPSNVGVRLQFTVYDFQFFWREFSLPRDCAGLFSKDRVMGRGATCGA